MSLILVVREFDDFSRILSQNDFSVINCPTIRTAPLEDLSEFEKKLAGFADYDGVFLTSRTAAEIFRRKLREKKIIFGGQVYVFGKSGFEILRNENLDLVFDETANTAREMLGRIAVEDLKDKRFLFVRGDKSLRAVPDFLSGADAAVDETVVYETRSIVVDADKINVIRDKNAKLEIACSCFFSPSGAESFLQQFGAEFFGQSKIAVIGKTTADLFEKRDLKADFVSPRATAEDFAVALIEYLQNGKRKAECGE